MGARERHFAYDPPNDPGTCTPGPLLAEPLNIGPKDALHFGVLIEGQRRALPVTLRGETCLDVLEQDSHGSLIRVDCLK